MTNTKTKTTKATERDRRPFSSLKSLLSIPNGKSIGFIPPHGGYKRLFSCHKTLVVHDATLYFCYRFIDKKSRTQAQMAQAARSGKQNILEGSQAGGTSKETEIKLTSVARSSQEELIEVNGDFMRNRRIEEWTPEHPYARRPRQLNRTENAYCETFRKGIEHPDPAICASIIAGLIKVTCYLLDQQLRRLEQDFLKEGGLRERMTRARLAIRSRHIPQH